MMRRLFLFIDERLRRRQNIEEFCDDPECMLRIKLCRADRTFALEKGEIRKGADVLELHLWNEHVPLRAGRTGLAWAARSRRAFVTSLAKLARHVQQRPELRGVAGVIGITTFMSPREAEAAERVLERLGFAHAPYSVGAFGDFWENLHVWFLHRTFCDGAGHKPLSGLTRRIMWMSSDDLLRRYAQLGSRPDRPRAPPRETGPVGLEWRSIS
ncbi:MAG TPA: hypothetical protein VFV10_11705 [Gammaproteobacteria bacterium]|nr:hypothetical protein [Gammaproteobacteria bacterium]